MVDQADKEKKAAAGNTGILGSILGLGGVVAGAIPSLLKSKQTGALRDMQKGHGAGATAARQAGAAAARNIVGASSAGHGRTRGLGLREGVRGAATAVEGASRAAGAIGAQEGQMGTSGLMADEAQRRGTGLKLGSALGGGLGALGTVLTAAKDQGAAEAAPAVAPGASPEMETTLAQGQAGLDRVGAANAAVGNVAEMAPVDQTQAETIQAGEAALQKVQAASPQKAQQPETSQEAQMTPPLAGIESPTLNNEVKMTLGEAQAALANKQHAWATRQNDTLDVTPGDTSLESRTLDKTWEWVQNEIYDGRLPYEEGMALWAEAQRRAKAGA